MEGGDYGLQLIRGFQDDCMYLDGQLVCLSVHGLVWFTVVGPVI